MKENEGKKWNYWGQLYAWNTHLTICGKMAFLNRDWSKLFPWIFAAVQTPLEEVFNLAIKNEQSRSLLQDQITKLTEKQTRKAD